MVFSLLLFDLQEDLTITMTDPNEPFIAKQAVLACSSKISEETPVVSGYDWNNGVDYDVLLGSYLNSGFQATNFGKAVLEINKMVNCIMICCDNIVFINKLNNIS